MSRQHKQSQHTSDDIRNDIKINVIIAIVLIIAIIIFSYLNLNRTALLQIESPNNVIFEKNTQTIFLQTLTLHQKIAQMIITYDKKENKKQLQDLLIGGIHIGAKSSKEEFLSQLNDYQAQTKIPFLFTIDLEGCGNPFESFVKFPAVVNISTNEEAYIVGYQQGLLLKELGFTINFAPVVDLNDTIWKCRSFNGTIEEISEKAASYIKGLQDTGIIATAKHFPGKTIIANDPHKSIVMTIIDKDDLEPFNYAKTASVSAIMVSHQITSGVIDSNGKPSTVSKEVNAKIKEQFDGLVISDEIGMGGLKNYYKEDITDLYIDVFNSGNDLIIYFNTDISQLVELIDIIETAVRQGKIHEKDIDHSVQKILEAKGFTVVNNKLYK
ncbi:hypothetical protein HZA96_00600 [Candidatus Woesearchaeota archaeon]|nr:hypothetical protein [Candidatus Woesearchaeota archaeon]